MFLLCLAHFLNPHLQRVPSRLSSFITTNTLLANAHSVLLAMLRNAVASAVRPALHSVSPVDSNFRELVVFDANSNICSYLEDSHNPLCGLP